MTGDTAGLGTAAVHHSELKVLIFSQAQVTCGLSARGSAGPQQPTLLPLPCPPTPNRISFHSQSSLSQLGFASSHSVSQ